MNKDKEIKKIFLSRLPTNYQNESMIDSCWKWKNINWVKKKIKSPYNYGYIKFEGKSYSANRISYIIFNGPVRLDQLIRHTCDNPGCVNPKHLIIGTHSDNSRDMVKRNRGGSQKLNVECVKVIKWMLKYKPKHGLASKLAQLHNTTPQAIYDIKKENTWSWIKI